MVDVKKLKIKISVKTQGGDYLVLFPDVPEDRVRPILHFIKEMYYSLTSDSRFLLIFVKDFEFYKTEFLSKYYKDDASLKKAVSAIDEFLDFASLGAEAITPENKVSPLRKIIDNFTIDEKNQMFAAYLFFYALLRYMNLDLEPSEVEAYSTLLDASALLNTLMNS